MKKEINFTTRFSKEDIENIKEGAEIFAEKYHAKISRTDFINAAVARYLIYLKGEQDV